MGWQYSEKKNCIVFFCITLFLGIFPYTTQYNSYLPSVCVELGTTSHLAMISGMWENVHQVNANAIPFHEHLSICRFWHLLGGGGSVLELVPSRYWGTTVEFLLIHYCCGNVERRVRGPQSQLCSEVPLEPVRYRRVKIRVQGDSDTTEAHSLRCERKLHWKNLPKITQQLTRVRTQADLIINL